LIGVEIVYDGMTKHDAATRGRVMDATKQARLEAQGWKVGSVDEFLELTPEESMLIEIKLALASSLRQRRRSQMTQRTMPSSL
jgi:hypothetical protein